MSFLVADAFPAGRVWDLGNLGREIGKPLDKTSLPDGCGLFECSDVVQFVRDYPGAVDTLALPVRPPLDAMWVEAAWPDKLVVSGRVWAYDRFGALLRSGDDADGNTWVSIEGYQRVGAAGRSLHSFGGVHRMPFVGGYQVDDRGMIVQDGSGGLSVFITPTFAAEEPPPPEYGESEAEAQAREIVAAGEDVPAEVLEACAQLEAAKAELAALNAKAADTRREVAGMLADWRPVFEVLAADVLQAVAVMNVRNTVREPMRASRQVRRARERDGLIDPADVTVLKVPGSQRYAAAGAGTGDGAAKAHHAVLGHFAYYGDTHPDGQPRGLLFGRQEGVFWHPPHWRGNREAGEVRHTYKVVVSR